MLDWTQCIAVERDPEKVGGEWLFKGTRVPVRALFENLESGARIDDFLDWFPGVTRDQVETVLKARGTQLGRGIGRAAGAVTSACEFFLTRKRPAPLRSTLTAHIVSTAYEMGWTQLDNGALLQAAEEEFDALITTDKNLRYQQGLKGRRLAILILPSTSWPKLQAYLPQIVTAIDALKPGDVRELTFLEPL